MDKNVTIEVRVLEAEASERTSSTSGEDTAGYAAQTPATMSRLFQVSPRVAVKLTLPDPAPEITVGGEDVQGYLWWIFGTAAAGLAAGYGIGSAYEDFVGHDEEYHKYPR